MAGWPMSKEGWDAFMKERAQERLQNKSQLEALDQQARHNERLSVLPNSRISTAAVASFAAGATLGIFQGSKTAGLRFRAEHAHKLPTTSTGWFMYHKSKNYVTAAGGVREGLRMGFKVSAWTTAMLLVENMYDQHRQHKDLLSTVMASLTVAGAFSLWNRFSLPMTARTTKTALVVGLAYGGLQDAIGFLRGRPIGYVDWVRTRLGIGVRQQEPKTSS